MPSSTKSKIIPHAWKENIDQILQEELLYANRYFAEANPNLARLIEIEAQSSPENYMRRLHSRWSWHHSFYEDLLEPAIDLLLEPTSMELSLEQVKSIRAVYETVSMVDQATLVLSAGIKKHIDLWVSKTSSAMPAEDLRILLTPPTEAFPVQYEIKHLEYVLLLVETDSRAEAIKEELKDIYHAGDEEIFRGRMKRFLKYQSWSPSSLCKRMEDLHISRQEKIRHFYLTLERPRLKAIRDILEYDNVEEYKILFSLIGISGFVFRKAILDYLNKTKILPNRGYIYEFPDETVLNALDKLSSYREEVSHKDVRHYRQTEMTCGAVCLMMTGHYLGKIPLDVKTEMELHQESKSRLVEGNHFSALAGLAVNMGLETILLHSESDMFRNDGLFPKDMFRGLMQEYNQHLNLALENGAVVENGTKVDSDTVLSYLRKGFLVVVAGNLGNILHSKLIVGYNPSGFMVRDPIFPSNMPERKEALDAFMNTKIGKWILVLRKDQSRLNRLTQSLDRFCLQARSFLSAR